MNISNALLEKILIIPAILIAFTFHELAHAYTADRLGDKTPRFQGRLTMNPLAHIDIIGFVMIMIVGFGWAKPVQTNPSAYRRYYKDDLKVSLAGPIANIAIAIIFTPILGLFMGRVSSLVQNPVLYYVIYRMIASVIIINVSLFFFNLLPLPGLDGFHVLRDLFPSTFNRIGYSIYKYQMIILILFLATPISNYIIGIPSDFVINLLFKIVKIF